MENQMTIFKNPAFGEVRTMTMENGQVGFVGKDIATALGYKNTRDALSKHVEEEDKTTVAFCDGGMYILNLRESCTSPYRLSCPQSHFGLWFFVILQPQCVSNA